LQQEFGGITGPAAKIDHAACGRERHLRQEIARRAGALILELQVLARAPVLDH